MKILYIIPNSRISGGVIVVLQHKKNLEEMGHEVVLATHDNSEKLLWKEDIELKSLKKIKKDEHFDIAIATFWATVDVLNKIDADRKLYFVQQDERNFYTAESDIRAVEETYKSKNVEFMTMARWIQDWLKDEFGKHSYYVPNGVDLNIFKPGESRIVRTPRILIEGKIHVPTKGVAEAYNIVSKFPCEKWIVSGDGGKPKEWKLDKFFCELRQDELAEVYQNCDVMLKMSRVESFALPPLEMMACGGTVIIRKVNGIEDYAVNGYNCLIVESYKEAVEALNKLIVDRKLLKELKTNALKTARKWPIENQKKYLEALINNKLNDEKSTLHNVEAENVMGKIKSGGNTVVMTRPKTNYKYSREDKMDNYSKYDLVQSIEDHKAYIEELEAVNNKNLKVIKKLLKEIDSLNKMIFAIRGSKIWKARNRIVKYLGRGPL